MARLRILPLVPVLLSAIVIGCAARTPGSGGAELVVVASGEASSLRIEGDRAWGPDVELTRFHHAYRGTLQGHVVDLHFTGDRVEGTIGSSRVDLHVSTVDGRVHGQGLLNGEVSSFDVDGVSIAGTFGRCAYDLKRKDLGHDDYTGYRSCSAGVSPSARVTIPELVRTFPALDQATLYALLLTG